MAKIVGNVVGVPSPYTDFLQEDSTKGDYLKNRDVLIELIKNSGINDLGTFQLIYDEDYNEVVNTTVELGKAIDNARKTGIYSVRYEEGQVQENEYGQEVSRNISLSETKLIIVIADVSGTHEVVTQFCLTQDNMDNGNNDYMLPLKMRKYYYDLEKNKYIWTQYQELENAQYKVDDINTPNINPMQCYPSVKAVSNFVNGKIVTDYGEWFEKTDGSDFDTKIPSIGVVYNYFENSRFLSEYDIVDTIPPDAEGFIYTNIPNVDALVNYVDSKLHPTPITEAPVTLVANKEYNFGWVSELSLSFPTIANDGDVIYVTFFAEDSLGGVPNLVIDTTNTSDIELIPEQSTGYEVFAKYNGEIWIVNYSEYTKW